MLIGFDASRAFTKENTGTENYSLKLLEALAAVDRKNRYRVYLREIKGSHSVIPHLMRDPETKGNKLDSRGRGNDNIRWPANFEFRTIRPNRLWTQFGLALETWRAPVDVLFVPAHTLPVLRRRSIGNTKCLLRKFFALQKSEYLNSKFKNSKGLGHSNLENSNLFRASDFVLRILNRFAKQTKYVVTIHDLGVEYLPGYHKFPQRLYLDLASKYAAREADRLIAVSRATKLDLIKRYGVPSDKISVVHEGVDKAVFRPSLKLKVQSVKAKYKIDGDYFLYVGTVQPRKNLMFLIDIFSKLVKTISVKTNTSNYNNSHQKISLILAGKMGWDWEEILARVKVLGLGNRVKFIGFVNTADLPPLYSGALAAVSPSLFEGFGLTILEALSCGCRVIASDIPAHREIYQAFTRGYNKQNFKFRIPNFKYSVKNSKIEPMVLAKLGREREWVRSLYQSVNNIYQIRADGQKSYLFESLFGWEKVAKQTLEVFNEVARVKK